MNPHPYLIANPRTADARAREFRGEYFDVYGPNVTTHYSEVSWFSQPVPLPADIVARFDNKVMAVTGYEVDATRMLPNGTEERVPCTQLYNHHYSGWMHGKAAVMRDGEDLTDAERADATLTAHGRPLPRFDVAPATPARQFPVSQVFSEGNGNEYRRSFKAYSKGYAQLIESPTTWANSPMIINGNKRLTGDASPGPVASLQPRKSLAPRGPNAAYNGLFECPCTSRKPKLLTQYHTVAEDPGQPWRAGDVPCAGVAAAVVETQSECSAGAALAGVSAAAVAAIQVVNDTGRAMGCFAVTDGTATTLVFNNHSLPMPAGRATGVVGEARAAPAVFTVAAEPTIAMQHVCRNVSVNTGMIAGGNFNAGVCAPYPVSELLTTHNSICNISAYGGGLHCCAGGSLLLDADQQVPEPTDTWRLKYRFFFEDYDALAPQRNVFRVWWSTEATNNEYDVPQSTADCSNASTPAEQCVHTIRSKFTGRDMVTTGCMVSGDPMGCMDPGYVSRVDGGYFDLVYASAHCHSPACLSVELWDDDTGELLCRNEPTYGNGSAPIHDELGFAVGIAPCLFGDAEEGLRTPPRLHLTSNLTTIKRTNNTYGHWGVMALWQNRAAYVTNPNNATGQ